MNGRACISLNMSVATIACLSDSPPPILSAAFWCLKMCRQRKVNTHIVPLNKRASPCISKACLCWGVFSSGGSLGILLTLPRMCANVHTCVHACCTSLCVKSASARQRGWGLCSGEAVWILLQQREQCTGLTFWQPSVLYSWMWARKYFFNQALCQHS